MPRDNDGVFTLPNGYLAVTGQTIQAGQHNAPLEDIAEDLNGLVRSSAIGAASVPATEKTATLAAHINYLRRVTPVSPRNYGALGDGNPNGTTEANTGTNDTAAVKAALAAAQDEDRELLLDGVFRVHGGELTVRETMTIRGVGGMTEYKNLADMGRLPLAGIRSGLLFTGTATPRIRTRRLHRAEASDPQDAPLSVGLDIEAPGTRLQNFGVWLWFNQDDDSPTNYGADYDVGIFNGCRPHVSLEDVAVLGYFRERNIYCDVTRLDPAPEFSDPDGVPFNRGAVTNGSDGFQMRNCYVHGHRWAVGVLGSLPPAGTQPADDGSFYAPYYDALADELITQDGRGAFGASDFVFDRCSLYNFHHSYRRTHNPTGTWQTDPAGGALEIDGLAGNSSGRIHNITIKDTRIASNAAFRVKLGWCSRVRFDNYHNEAGAVAFNTSGASVDPNDYPTHTYARICADERATRIILTRNNTTHAFDTNFEPGSNGMSFVEHSQDVVEPTMYLGYKTRLRIAKLEALGGEGLAGDEMEFICRTDDPADGVGFRWRIGGTSEFIAKKTAFLPSSSGTTKSLGEAGTNTRWDTVYLANSPDVSSDARGKEWLGDLDERERAVAVALSKLGGVYTKRDGDGRRHVGITAQQVIAAFDAAGLDWRGYAVVSEGADGMLSVNYDDLQGWQIAGFGVRMGGA